MSNLVPTLESKDALSILRRTYHQHGWLLLIPACGAVIGFFTWSMSSGFAQSTFWTGDSLDIYLEVTIYYFRIAAAVLYISAFFFFFQRIAPSMGSGSIASYSGVLANSWFDDGGDELNNKGLVSQMVTPEMSNTTRVQDLTREYFDLVRRGSVTDFRDFVRNHAFDLNTQHKHTGNTALIQALYEGRDDFIDYLIADNSVNPHITNKRGDRTITLAVRLDLFRNDDHRTTTRKIVRACALYKARHSGKNVVKYDFIDQKRVNETASSAADDFDRSNGTTDVV